MCCCKKQRSLLLHRDVFGTLPFKWKKTNNSFFCIFQKRLQLDMVLSSLQDQSHVSSLLGYSHFGEGTSLGPPLTPVMSARLPSSSSSVESYNPLHLAEVLLRTLLLSIGVYTVCKEDLVPLCATCI